MLCPHELAQIEPRRLQHGAAIPVRPDSVAALLDYLDGFDASRFYVHFAEIDGTHRFSNLDYEDTVVTGSGPHLIIQSGGKMWCGYDDFISKLRDLAPFVENATIFIADDNDFVDHLEFADGRLKYERVHSGSWFALEDYFELHGI